MMKDMTRPPDHPRRRAWRLRRHAEALWEMGRFAEAARAAQDALALEPESARALCTLAQAQSGMGLTDEALHSAERACAADPAGEQGHRLRAIYHTRRQEHTPAVAAAREAVRLAPDSDLTLAALSDALHGAGDLEGALRAALRIREVAPASVWACERYGGIALARRHYAEAEAFYREGLALDPLHNVCLANLAWALLYQGRPGEAIPFLMDTIRHHPEGGHIAWAEDHLRIAILAHLGDYPSDHFPVEAVSEGEKRRRWDALPEAVRQRYEADVRRWYETRDRR